MSRIVPYANTADHNGELGELFKAIEALRGRILNMHLVLANVPPALTAFMAMSRYVRNESSLVPSLRELAIVTVASALRNEYELFHHRPLALDAGISAAVLKDIETWPNESQSLSETQRAIVDFSWHATRNQHVPATIIETAARLLTTTQLVDLAMTVGWYHLSHVLIDTLNIEIESD